MKPLANDYNCKKEVRNVVKDERKWWLYWLLTNKRRIQNVCVSSSLYDDAGTDPTLETSIQPCNPVSQGIKSQNITPSAKFVTLLQAELTLDTYMQIRPRNNTQKDVNEDHFFPETVPRCYIFVSFAANSRPDFKGF